MPTLVAFASLPFSLQAATYAIKTSRGTMEVHVTRQDFNPFVTVTSRPELAQMLPQGGEGPGFTSYTWYDHPFVLRVVFGRNVAALGSINSCGTILQPLPQGFDLEDQRALARIRKRFADQALEALNRLIALVRQRARLYQVFDLQRGDIDVTVREDGTGAIIYDDPLQEELLEAEQAQTETFDLLEESNTWYKELREALEKGQMLSLGDSLLIEAERALAQRFPRQSIATCHTAIEATASALLTAGMQRRGMRDHAIDHLLSTRSLTSKLEVLLRKNTGFSLKQDNYPLWRAFNDLNDLRNDIVHRGQAPDREAAEFAISVTRDLIHWLDVVRQRNNL